MAFKHGVYTSEVPTAILPARTVDSNVVFAVGTAAVHTLADDAHKYINEPRLYNSYDEYVAEMGWDDFSWDDFSLQELVYSHFALYRGAPLVVVNVFDPTKHKTQVVGVELIVPEGGRIMLDAGDLGYLADVTVTNTSEDEPIEYVVDEDYEIDLSLGLFTLTASSRIHVGDHIKFSYSYLDPSKVTSADIIGGVDVETGKSTGLELIDSVFPLYRVVPGSILAPRFCEDPAVAIVMGSKATNINGLFQAIAIVDIPCSGERGVRKYTEVPAYKQNNNLTSPRLIACWPKVKLGDHIYGLATHVTGLMSQTDWSNDGIPYASSSNKQLQITSIGMPTNDNISGWEELALGMDKVNTLNGEGIYSALNWDGGLRSWGGRMACYPTNTDPKDCQEPIRRMFNWFQNTFILTWFQKVDYPITKRLIKTITASEQIRLDGFTSRGYILGGEISFESTDNPVTDLMDGILRFRIKITPPPAARDIEATFEFDTENLKKLFG